MTGTVFSISEDTVVVSPAQTLECFGCMKQDCKAHSGRFAAKNTLGLPLSVGQVVDVASPKGSVLKQTLWGLLPPVAVFLGCYALSGVLFPLSGDPARAFCGILAFFITAFVIYRRRKRFSTAELPYVARVKH